MIDFINVIGKLGTMFNSNEIIVYLLLLESKDKVDISNLFHIINKNKIINILRDFASKGIVDGELEDNILVFKNLLPLEKIFSNNTLEVVVTTDEHDRGGGHRIANSSDIRGMILPLVLEEEKHIARKYIRKTIEICNKNLITDKQLKNYIKQEIDNKKDWKNIISPYCIRKKFDKNFSPEEID